VNVINQFSILKLRKKRLIPQPEKNIYKATKLNLQLMNEEAGIRFNNFVPIRNVNFRLVKDEETGIESLILDGIAHSYKRNLKQFIIPQTAARKAVRRFNANLDAGRIHQVWIDHAYANFFAVGTPSEKVIGHVEKLKAPDEGLKYILNLNTEHPSQIHKAILRRDIGGISIGADVKRENIICSVDNAPFVSQDCDHYIGQKLDNGKIVGAIVNDYELDELTVTAKPADLDSTINFSAFTIDAEGKKIADVSKITFINDEQLDESFKSVENKDKVDTNMTTDVKDQTDPNLIGRDEVANLISDAVKGVSDGFETKLNESFDKINQYITKESEDKEALVLAEKTTLVDKILSDTKEFEKDELLTFDISILKKLQKNFTKDVSGSAPNHGQARVGNDELGNEGERFTLSKADKKAWLRMKLGWKPEAPAHIVRKVRARMNGDENEDSEEFRAYLATKYGDDK